MRPMCFAGGRRRSCPGRIGERGTSMLRRLLLATAIGTLAVAGATRAQESAATKAVEAAKQFSGSAITVVAEAGLQALLDKQFTGPEWEQLTGIKVNVVELNFEEIYPKTILERQAGTGAYDVRPDLPGLARRHGRQRRCHSARPLHRQVRLQGRVRRRQPGLQGLDDLQRQDLRARRRRRRAGHLLPQGSVRGSRRTKRPSRPSTATTWVRPRTTASSATSPAF